MYVSTDDGRRSTTHGQRVDGIPYDLGVLYNKDERSKGLAGAGSVSFNAQDGEMRNVAFASPVFICSDACLCDISRLLPIVLY